MAGLQAIATAKRLGAAVEAFDTRPVVEEQVKSLGAKFVKVDLGEMGQTKDGYAKALTPGQLERQREVMAKHCASSQRCCQRRSADVKSKRSLIARPLRWERRRGPAARDGKYDLP